ncbi:MAG: glycogen debranching N-terminal domain-containing protein, partial [Mycetocola sp.]
MHTHLQPLLHDETILLRAPMQAWSSPNGAIGPQPIHGIYLADVRLVSALSVQVGGHRAEPIASVPRGASGADFVSLLRHIDDAEADPRVRLIQERSVSVSGASEVVVLESTLTSPVTTTVSVTLGADLASMESVKSGNTTSPVSFTVSGGSASWGSGTVSVSLSAPDAALTVAGESLELMWDVTIPAKGSVSVSWSLEAVDTASVVSGAVSPVPWSIPDVSAGDDRLAKWVDQALSDLDALRLS